MYSKEGALSRITELVSGKSLNEGEKEILAEA
jgi:hypothetical protein